VFRTTDQVFDASPARASHGALERPATLIAVLARVVSWTMSRRFAATSARVMERGFASRSRLVRMAPVAGLSVSRFRRAMVP
jgi:hypothetical protein